MTVKEIAETVGRDVRNVNRWIEKILHGHFAHVDRQNAHVDTQNAGVTAGTIESIRLKAGNKDPHHPADYTPEEAMLIVEAGLGKNAAGIWRANLGMAAELAQIKEKLLDYTGFRADIQKFLENNSQKALPDPKELAYQELAGFVKEHLVITGKYSQDTENVDVLYDAYRAFVNHILPIKAFMYRIALDNPEIELIKRRSKYEFAGCCRR
jgi:hypothetical protein